MLTPQQLEQYWNDGYLLVRNVLSQQQLSALQQVTQDYLEASRAIVDSDEVFDLDVGHSAETPRLNRIKSPYFLHQAYHDVLHSDAVLNCIRPILGGAVRMNNSKLNAKASNGGAAVQWHQDWAFYPHTNDNLLAVGILLSDIDEHNGPLQMIPGSHRGPVLDHSRDGVFCGAIDPADPAFEQHRAVSVTGKAGDISLHHVRILHGSAPNHSDTPRLLLFYELGAADAWPLGGIQSVFSGLDQTEFWRAFNDRMIVGEPCLTPRLEDVPVRMPLAPAPDSTSIFKVQSSGGAVDAFA